jgi:hypothetical protein
MVSRVAHAGLVGPGWRIALTGLLTVIALSIPGASADSVGPADLDPLLRALSIRPWWGDPPPVALAGLDGERQVLHDARGQVVLLYFWATW